MLLLRGVVLLALLACAVSTSAANYYFSDGGIYYRLTTYNDGSGVISVENNGTNTYSGLVAIPDSVEYNGVNYPVTTIGYQAFKDCAELTGVKMPEGIKMLMNESFAGCTSLTRITLPSTLRTIYNNAFTGCSNLMDIICLMENPVSCNENNFDSYNYNNTILHVPGASIGSYFSTSPWSKFLHIRAIVTLDEALNVEGGNIEFTDEGDYPWVVKEGDGRLYAQSSNAGIHSSYSTFTATVRVTEPSVLSFDFKAWGESDPSNPNTNYDECVFMMNGTSIFRYGARDNDWETFTVDLNPNITYRLVWFYHKDVNENGVGDYFAVDNIRIVSQSHILLNEALNVEGGNIEFTDEGDYPWVVKEGDGRLYAQSSNAGIHSSYSTFTATVRVTEPSVLSFDFKAWGESDPSNPNTNYDECVFMMNGTSIFRYGARDNDWETFTVDLNPNVTYRLVWFYHKDVNENGEGDYFAVDNIKIAPKSIRGDVNDDGSVNIADVTSLIDYLLSSNASGANLSAADCNQDTSINIADVTALIDYLLSGNWP